MRSDIYRQKDLGPGWRSPTGWWTPEGDYLVERIDRSHEWYAEGVRFVTYRVAKDGTVLRHTANGNVNWADAMHDLELDKSMRYGTGTKPADGTPGPAGLSAMFPLGRS